MQNHCWQLEEHWITELALANVKSHIVAWLSRLSVPVSNNQPNQSLLIQYTVYKQSSYETSNNCRCALEAKRDRKLFGHRKDKSTLWMLKFALLTRFCWSWLLCLHSFGADFCQCVSVSLCVYVCKHVIAGCEITLFSSRPDTVAWTVPFCLSHWQRFLNIMLCDRKLCCALLGSITCVSSLGLAQWQAGLSQRVTNPACYFCFH